MRFVGLFLVFSVFSGCLGGLDGSSATTLPLGVVVSSSTLQSTTMAPTSSSLPGGGGCGSYPAGAGRDNCYLLLAVDEGSGSFCSMIGGGGARDSCNMRFALNEFNATYCMNISSFDLRHTCLSRIAYAFNDSSVCDVMRDVPYMAVCYWLAVSNDSVYEPTEDICPDSCWAARFFDKSFSVDDPVLSQAFLELSRSIYVRLNSSGDVEYVDKALNKTIVENRGCPPYWEEAANQQCYAADDYLAAGDYESALAHARTGLKMYERCYLPCMRNKCLALEQEILVRLSDSGKSGYGKL
ncbi:MAG: hypothetical protein ABIH11_07700 [Candidatus Altiarchaeota archaeon]